MRGAAPLLPADNWWNLDVRAAPVDPNLAAYLAFIDNGGTRRLHPDYAGITKSAPLAVQPAAPPSLGALTLQPASVVGGQGSIGSVALTAPAPAGGVVVGLASSNPSLATVPASVTVPAGASSATFAIGTGTTRRNRSVTLSASAAGRTLQATLTVTSR